MQSFGPPITWGVICGSALIFGLLGAGSVWAAEPQVGVATVVVTDDGGPELSPSFMGLSYEMSLVLPQGEKYYFDAKDEALLNTFHTLGIESLRVGAFQVDNPKTTVPQEKDIDALFAFARSAGVKVIYSFRLRNGNPAESARLAAYIAAHYADLLDCFSIGNEPNGYEKSFEDYFAIWKPHYDAILKAVPQAMFDGPSVYAAEKNFYPAKLSDAMTPSGHMAMISDHYYVMGAGRKVEQNLDRARDSFLSNASDTRFAKAFATVGAPLMAKNISYRIDELNNCSNGGAKGVSDTYAASLWALDATHWWAAHHILGLNYHTGERPIPGGGIGGQNYTAFIHQADGKGMEIRPESYGYLAFKEGALGRSLGTAVTTTVPDRFTAYAYRAKDQSLYVTLINKTYGNIAEPIAVSVHLPQGVGAVAAQRMDLIQKNNDLTAQTDITLGGSPIDSQGHWVPEWKTAQTVSSSTPLIEVAPSSAAIVHFFVSK